MAVTIELVRQFVDQANRTSPLLDQFQREELETAFFYIFEQLVGSGGSLLIETEDQGTSINNVTTITVTNGSLTAGAPGEAILQTGGGGDPLFDGDREIKTLPQVGVNYGTSTVSEFLEAVFFGFVEASVGLDPLVPLSQIGTTTIPNITGSVTPNDSVIVQRDIIDVTGGNIVLGQAPNNAINFNAPSITTDNTYRADISITNDGNPATIMSNEVTFEFVYPFLWGMSSTDGLVGSALYDEFTKQIQKQTNKTVEFTGAIEYVYFAYPDIYPALTQIVDQNLFDITGAFTLSVVSVSSTGLDFNWTIDYKVYQHPLTTLNADNWQFRF